MQEEQRDDEHDRPRQEAQENRKEIVRPRLYARVVAHGVGHAPDVLLVHKVEELLSALSPRGVEPQGVGDERQQSEEHHQPERLEEASAAQQHVDTHDQARDDGTHGTFGKRADTHGENGQDEARHLLHVPFVPAVEHVESKHRGCRQHHVHATVAAGAV